MYTQGSFSRNDALKNICMTHTTSVETVTSCTHAHYGYSCHFAIRSWWLLILTSNVFPTVRCRVCCYYESKQSTCCSARDIWGLETKPKILKLYVAQGNCPSLFGHGWIWAYFGSELPEQCTLPSTQLTTYLYLSSCRNYWTAMLTPFSNQISGRWGYHSLPHPPNLKSGKSLRTLCNPSHFRAQIGTTLDQMEIEGSLGKNDFDHCEWATPIDPVISQME